MNLLAESQGLPDALRVLSLFEHEFSMLWTPKNIQMLQKRETLSVTNLVSEKGDHSVGGGALGLGKIEEEEGTKLENPPQTLIVAWDDAQIAEYFHQ